MGGVYIDSSGGAGFLTGEFTGSFEPGIEMFRADGIARTYEMQTGLGIQPEALHQSTIISEDRDIFTVEYSGFLQEETLIGQISVDERHRLGLKLPEESWGVSQVMNTGTYDEAVGDDWLLFSSFDAHGIDVTKQAEIIGTKWSDNKIEAHGSGAWVNWDSAVTGVTGGKLLGVFDPNQLTWAAVGIWNSVDTNRFIDLAGTEAGREILQGLNIPCIEVGKATLSGSNDPLTVIMNDVTFFSYSTPSAPPRIWATNDVSGSYSQTPDIGHQLLLSGDGLNADFEVRRWEGNSWGANVEGSGTLNNNGFNVDFRGGAAGTYTGTPSGTIQGTGSGVVIQPQD